ncbi:serine hydrolase domain-containing protein [Ornithinimicrobium cerasi]|uniref:serine hydrolase domain-containing protein n=1 Tax=Ornithinimicrobium cerasi TaxID=2248773 RepID=UPI000F008DD5|nr:serine hydrolase domain-containing protein [Ornithinimicrobium cerasi]
MEPRTAPPGSPVERIGVGEPPAALDQTVEAMMHKGAVPGLSVAVVSRERVLLARGYGLADLRTQAPATASTSYLWFSMTKIVTATAALRLADEGRLDLDAPVGEYVPDLKAPGGRQPQVGQLLNHTAGLANPLPVRWAHRAEAPAPDPAALLRRVTRGRRAFRRPPGGAARYSNVGYLALGQVVEAAAGMPFERYARRAVLRPLGMRTAFTYSPGTERATGYVRAARIVDPLLRRVLPEGIVGDRHGRHLSLNPFYVDGRAYGGLVGDVMGAGRFLRMHLRDGELDGERILAPGTARRMRVIDQPGKVFEHGLGWFRRPTGSPEDRVEHYGTGVGFWNVMRLYPDRGIGVVVMSNSTTSYAFEPMFSLLAGASWS